MKEFNQRSLLPVPLPLGEGCPKSDIFRCRINSAPFIEAHENINLPSLSRRGGRVADGVVTLLTKMMPMPVWPDLRVNKYA